MKPTGRVPDADRGKQMTHWGLVATIKAPVRDVLNFAAYHLDQGAHRLYIYLDEASEEAFTLLKSHPKVRVATCDAAFWARQGGKRPIKHQVRQSRNATHAYARKPEVDWLAHIDVDEFLSPSGDIAQILAALPPDILCARIRPVEVLADGDGTAFKGFIPSGPHRARIVDEIYPTYGTYLKGGFLSHVAGKLFVRTGLDNVTYKIHNMFQGDVMNPGQTELPQVDLCHFHARTWQHWIESYQYRLEKGAYRAELAAAAGENGVNLHHFLLQLDRKGGTDALRRFFAEVAQDTPDLRQRLQAQGVLRSHDLNLDRKRRALFPGT